MTRTSGAAATAAANGVWGSCRASVGSNCLFIENHGLGIKQLERRIKATEMCFLRRMLRILWTYRKANDEVLQQATEYLIFCVCLFFS